MKTRTIIDIFAVFAFIVIIFCLFAACNNPGSVNTYTVAFETNGGSIVKSQTVISGNTAVRPEQPTREGYTFDNWYSDSDLTALYNFDLPVTANITLYANWHFVMPDFHTVTFNSNGGSHVASHAVTPGNTATRPENPEREGFTFVEWVDADSGSPYNFDTPVNSDITLYATWNEIPNITYYYVYFDSQGGSYVEPLEVAENSAVAKPDDPIRNGFTFVDWYTDSGSPYNFDNPVTGNITLYAKWNEIPGTTYYYVSFDSQGGSSVERLEVAENGTVTRPADPTTEGYTFDYWYRYNDDTPYNFDTPVTANITLYAKWLYNRTVNFNSDGGSAVPSQSVPEGRTVTKPADPTKDGYIFFNWYRDSGRTTLYDFDTAVTTNITLYAQWVPEFCTVRFESYYSAVPSQTVPYGGTVTKPADPTRDGYTFNNWELYSNIPYDFNTPVTGNIDLLTSWLVSRTVDFDSDGGSAVPSQIVGDSRTATRPADPTKEGYTFDNWYEYNNNTPYDFNTPITANRTFFAKWIINLPITITNLMSTYLSAQSGGSSADDPVNLPLNIQLTETNWRTVLTAINSANKYVTLDLSWCSRSDSSTGGGLRSDGTFDPIASTSTGKNRIVSIMLPDAATTTASGDSTSPTFRYFDNLKSASGKNITSIGEYTFDPCASLISVDFPAVTTIGSWAFAHCTSLTSVDFPEVTTIGDFAFRNCTSLTSMNIPEIISIKSACFSTTGTAALTITMGNTPPVVATSLFANVSSSKSVTILIPVGAVGYGSSPTDRTTLNWGNGFRGRGTDFSAGYETVNNYINLVIQEY